MLFFVIICFQDKGKRPMSELGEDLDAVAPAAKVITYLFFAVCLLYRRILYT